MFICLYKMNHFISVLFSFSVELPTLVWNLNSDKPKELKIFEKKDKLTLTSLINISILFDHPFGFFCSRSDPIWKLNYSCPQCAIYILTFHLRQSSNWISNIFQKYSSYINLHRVEHVCTVVFCFCFTLEKNAQRLCSFNCTFSLK